MVFKLKYEYKIIYSHKFIYVHIFSSLSFSIMHSLHFCLIFGGNIYSKVYLKIIGDFEMGILSTNIFNIAGASSVALVLVISGP